MFCSNCGEELPENAYFCLKCGVRTVRGREAKVSVPWDDVFHDVAEEMKKAFTTAGREMEKAFKTASEEIRKTTIKKSLVCSNCSEKNYPSSRFCHKCGNELKKEK